MSLWHFVAQNRVELLQLILEHIWLVGVSLFFAVLLGIPLGILVTRWPVLNRPILGGANIIQTIPSLALFGFLLPAPWFGERADRMAIFALTLYALLPLIRNTYAGINGVDHAIVEADRKSTRLNSSHVRISYAVFCLKKKKKGIRAFLQKLKKSNQKHRE